MQQRFLSLMALAAVLLLAGCGSSGGGGGSPSTPPPPPPAATITNADIVGTWDVAIDGASYCRVVFDLDGNMTSCSDTTFHVGGGGYLIQTSIPYPPATYSAKILIQNDWIEPNPLQIFTSTIYTGYLTTDKQTWLGTYTSSRLNNGAIVGTQTGSFRATKVPSGSG
jgi:hypothetical protein